MQQEFDNLDIEFIIKDNLQANEGASELSDSSSFILTEGDKEESLKQKKKKTGLTNAQKLEKLE